MVAGSGISGIHHVIGIPRLLGFCGSNAEVRAAYCNFHSAREEVAELKAFPKPAQAATTSTLGDMPLAYSRTIRASGAGYA